MCEASDYIKDNNGFVWQVDNSLELIGRISSQLFDYCLRNSFCPFKLAEVIFDIPGYNATNRSVSYECGQFLESVRRAGITINLTILDQLGIFLHELENIIPGRICQCYTVVF
jgi:hypothetical protein